MQVYRIGVFDWLIFIASGYDTHKSFSDKLTMFRTLFNSFFEICLFQRAPQDLPASNYFLGMVLGLLAICGFVINLVNLPTAAAAIAVLLNLAVLIIITQLVLRLHNKSARFTQTLTALAGVGIVLAIIAIPVIVMLQYAHQHQVDTTLGVIFWMLLFTWEIAVTAHILRHALSTSLLHGFMFAILYPVVYFQLFKLLVPATA